MVKLVVGAEYVDLTRNDGMRLVYIGPGQMHEVFSADGTPQLVQVMRGRVNTDIVEWNSSLHRPLEPKQVWKRTRHDYTGQSAVIIVLAPYMGVTWVLYEVIGGSSSEPKIKREKDFRRIFGQLVE